MRWHRRRVESRYWLNITLRYQSPMRPWQADSPAIWRRVRWSGPVRFGAVAKRASSAWATSIHVDGSGVAVNIPESVIGTGHQQLDDVIEMPLIWVNDIDGSAEHRYCVSPHCFLNLNLAAHGQGCRTTGGTSEPPGVCRHRNFGCRA